MVTQPKLYTVEEYLAVALLPENEHKRLELIEGQIVEMPPSSQLNTLVAFEFGMFMRVFARQHDLGYVVGADSGFELALETVRQPDTAFIAKARKPTFDRVTFPFPPDIAVEVISESETSRSVLDKTMLYLQAGTAIVVNIYPTDKVIDVCRLSEEKDIIISTLKIDEVFDGGDVLPGFKLPLRDIFPKANNDD